LFAPVLIEQFLYALQNALLQTGRFCQPSGDGNAGIGTVILFPAVAPPETAVKL
jgi:hypothetical protein